MPEKSYISITYGEGEKFFWRNNTALTPMTSFKPGRKKPLPRPNSSGKAAAAY
jgi:hypothetical protein